MKEQVKCILFDFKNAKWSVQKVEKELGFSNGTLGKVVKGKSGLSEFRFQKLMDLHQEKIGKPITILPELTAKIEENRNNPLINAARGRDESGVNEDENKDKQKEIPPKREAQNDPKEGSIAFMYKYGVSTYKELEEKQKGGEK